jgi:transposase
MTSPEKRKNFRYSAEYKARALRMVRQLTEEMGTTHGTVSRVAAQLGCNAETLRQWVREEAAARGKAEGAGMSDAERVIELEQEVRELRRANDILKSASAFFAAELDRPQN